MIKKNGSSANHTATPSIILKMFFEVVLGLPLFTYAPRGRQGKVKPMIIREDILLHGGTNLSVCINGHKYGHNIQIIRNITSLLRVPIFIIKVRAV